MPDRWPHSGQYKDPNRNPNSQSNPDTGGLPSVPPLERAQRRQDTTSSYTSIGATPDFETLLNEQAGSRDGEASDRNVVESGSGQVWELGGFGQQASPIENGDTNAMDEFAYRQLQNQQQQHHQQHFHRHVVIPSNQGSASFVPSHGLVVPLSAPVQGRRFSSTASLPRDRRRSSGNSQETPHSGQLGHGGMSYSSNIVSSDSYLFAIVPRRCRYSTHMEL